MMIAIPKTYTELIKDLAVGESLPISRDKRATLSVIANKVKNDTDREFTIRTIKETGEIRIWRVK